MILFTFLLSDPSGIAVLLVAHRHCLLKVKVNCYPVAT